MAMTKLHFFPGLAMLQCNNDEIKGRKSIEIPMLRY
jgi:hypothetical protein